MIRLRPATDQDKPFLKQLSKEVYEAVVVEQFGAWDDQREERKFDRKWRTQSYRIVEQSGRKIGAVWTSKEADHIWLREIQISSEFQNQGIGTQLIFELIDEARESGLPLRLRVLTANRAKTLYERIGFRITGKHEDTHYWMEYSP